MTLLTIVQAICDEVGVQKPTTVVGSAEPTAIQMLALANRGGKILARRSKGMGGWTVLMKENEFETVASDPGYDLPSDFDHFVDETLWDRENFWKLRGPITAQEWQVYKSGLVSSGPRRRVRLKPESGVRKFYVDPTPDAAETLVYEYITKNWCQSASGTGQSAWAADTDVPLLDDQLIEMDLRWRFLRAKQLDYAEEKQEFELELNQALARDGGNRKLHVGSDGDVAIDDGVNVPDGSWLQ